MDERTSVLIVDDQPAVADLAALHLERLGGFDVTTETTVREALDRINNDPDAFECIVSDYTMPGMDGLAFLEAIRERDPEFPFVLFTGKGSEEIASEAISAGVTDYLQKDTGVEQYELLANRVENAVERHRAERRARDLERINGVIREVQRELVRRSTREGIEESVCRCLSGSEPYRLAWIGGPDAENTVVPRERAGIGTAYLDDVTIRADDTPEGRGPAGLALRTRAVQVAQNMSEDDRFEPWREVIEQYGHESVIVLPLTHETTSYGVLVVYSNRVRAFDGVEQAVLEGLAGTIGQAIHAAETREALEARERALAESERKYRSLIDAAPDAIFVADAEMGELVETNAAAETLLGRSYEEIIGMDQSELHPEGEGERYRQLFEQHVGGNGVARFEDGSDVLVERADGETVPVEISAGTVDVGGRTLIQGLFREVGGRRERERRLGFFKQAVGGVGIGVCAYTEDGRIAYANDAYAQLSGTSREELAGTPVWELSPEFDQASFESFWADLKEGETYQTETIHESVDGETVPVGVTVTRTSIDETVYHLTTVNDITERKRQERELREERAVAESLFDATPDAVYAFDAEGRMLRWNDEFARTVGYTDEEIAGMNCLEFIPEEDRERIRDSIVEIIEADAVVTIESYFVTKAGEYVPHEFRGARLTDEEGAVYGLIGSGRDITDRIEREEAVAALHAATRELVRADTRVDVARLTAEAAEEVLGYPLNAVRLYDPETDTLQPTAVPDATVEALGERPAYNRGEAMPWRAFESGEAIVTSGEKPDDDIQIRHRLYAPMGEHGTISIAAPDAAIEDVDVRIAQLLAANAAAALDRLEREQRLRRYERMLDAAGDMIYSLDAEGRFTAVNDATVTTTGYASEALVGEHASMILEAEEIHRSEGRIHDLLSRGTTDESDSFELAIHAADGSTVPGECHIAPLRSNGEFEGTVGVVRDITERKAREEMLEALHDATRGMMETKTKEGVADVAVETVERVLDMPVNGIWLYDEEDDVLRPAVLSKRGRELIETPPTYTGGDSLSWQAFETGETRRYDHVQREPDVRNPETPIRSEIVVPLGEYGVMNIGSTEAEAFDESDVSLAKLLAANTEAALTRAERERQLVAERDRLTALFENTSDCVIETEFNEGEPLVRRVNPAFEATFGFDAETLIGNPIDEFIVPEGKEREAATINQRIPGEVEVEVRRETASGQRDFLFRAVPFETETETLYTYGVYTDITDQKRHERDLERQNELLDEFAGVISHDLRNPMSVARGRLELAHADCPSEHHEPAEEALSRMSALIEDVLTLARQGRVIGETERASLASLAETAWVTAGGTRATLEMDDPGEVEGDPDRLLRLFENLFRNASEHAGEDATVAVGPLDGGGFFVADDGPGVPESERERVFEHGYSTAGEGTGLGLTICRSIVEAHDWTVSVTESDAGGARFEVRP